MPRRVSLFGLALCLTISAAAQNRPLALDRTGYALRAGEPAQIVASDETLDFLLKAKTRRVEIAGAPAQGLAIGPNRAGNQILLAASQRMQPGEYTVKISAAGEAGEQRETTLDVLVKPRQAVPSGASRPPVVLLNGWETGYSNSCPLATSSSDTFGNLAQYLISDGVPIVYLFDNCLEGADVTIENLGKVLGQYLNSIQYADGTQVPQIDLVAHSMGGLIARAYLAGLQPSETLAPPADTLVRDLVLIATPNFGSFVAGNYSTSIAVGSQSAELIPGSSFLWNLATWNQRGDDLRGVNALAVIGNAGSYVPGLTSTTALANASDGLVSLTSASLGFILQTSPATRIVPYCHIDPSAFTNTTFGTYLCDAPGIANVTSTSQYTGQIVRSFLAGTTDWQSIGTAPSSDPYLSTDGGMYFALVNATDSYVTNLAAVAWGTISLLNGADTDTIYYSDFINGTGAYEATISSAGTYNCGTLTEALGYFSAARCKLDTVITSVGPLAATTGRAVNAGATLTISGLELGSHCDGCYVTVTPAGSTTSQALSVTSWTSASITAVLPAGLTGLATLSVEAIAGSDSITIFLVSPTATIAAAPASLAFSATAGGASPASQSIQITNGGAGTLDWSANSSVSWLSLSPASGTAPSTLSVSASPVGLSAGMYTGAIQITSAGATNTPLSVSVTLTVAAAAPAIAVAPQTVTFNYTVGSAAPAAQDISIANAGAGTLQWTASSSAFWLSVSPASGTAPSTVPVSVNPGNLAAGAYNGTVQITAAGASGSPASLAVTLVVQGTQAAGTITSVANAASFAAGFASTTWVSIFGTNLSQLTYTWQAGDFVDAMLPTSLEGVSVSIDGLPAYVEYISPTQINVLAPDDATTGSVQVQVTTAQQAGNAVTAPKQPFAPAFFTIDNGAYVAAIHADYTLVDMTAPAAPGETIVLYGTGFGPTDPPVPTAQLVTAPTALANPVQIAIGGVNATVVYAGLVESGLYQFNVTVPASLPGGDASVVAIVEGVQTQTGLAITIQ
ncbi:MAG: IPT/TIG domain-containing protein [Bryobacteraceae bacterium]